MPFHFPKLSPALKCLVRILLVGFTTMFVLVSIRLAEASRYAGGNEDRCFQQSCFLAPNDQLPLPAAGPGQPGQFDLSMATFLTDGLLRLHAYPPHPGLQRLTELDTKQTAKDPSKYALGEVYAIPERPDVLVILFRGSKYFQDWMANFAISQESHRLAASLKNVFRSTMQLTSSHRLVQLFRGSFAKVNGVKRLQQTPIQDGAEVHQGFLSVYEQVRDQIWMLVDQPQVTQVWLAGFSLGGAMANLCAMDLAVNGLVTLKEIRVYTAGAPRVGNPTFAHQLNGMERISQFFQMQNSADVIPTLPIPVVPNFSKPAKPFVYEHAGTVLSYTDNWGSLLLNHNISNYLTALTNRQNYKFYSSSRQEKQPAKPFLSGGKSHRFNRWAV